MWTMISIHRSTNAIRRTAGIGSLLLFYGCSGGPGPEELQEAPTSLVDQINLGGGGNGGGSGRQCDGAGTPCDDGNECTTNDRCRNGLCVGREITCAASDQCHQAPTCDPSFGCNSQPKPDGTACN